MGFNLGSVLGGIANPAGAIGTVGAGLLGGGLDYLGAQQQNASARQQADQQMAFQERMSDTAHQREVADLKAAGLNPVLSVNSGASTPVGSAAPVVSELGSASYGANRGVSSAFQAASTLKGLESSDASIAVDKANKILIDRNADVAKESARRMKADADTSESESVGASQEAGFLKQHPNYMQIKKAMELVAPILGSARDVGLTYRSIKGLDKPPRYKWDGKFDKSDDEKHGF